MSGSESLTMLTLNPDNPSNTSITSEDGKTLYVVDSQMGRKGTTLHVRDAGGATIAMVEYRATGFPLNRVTIRDQAPVSLGSWLSKSMIPFRDDVTFKDDAGRRYKWKGTAPGQSLELFTEDDNFQRSIARFYRSSTTDKTDPPSLIPATLALAPRAEEIRDLVVASFVCLERDRRASSLAVENRVEARVLAGQFSPTLDFTVV